MGVPLQSSVVHDATPVDTAPGAHPDVPRKSSSDIRAHTPAGRTIDDAASPVQFREVKLDAITTLYGLTVAAQVKRER